MWISSPFFLQGFRKCGEKRLQRKSLTNGDCYPTPKPRAKSANFLWTMALILHVLMPKSSRSLKTLTRTRNRGMLLRHRRHVWRSRFQNYMGGGSLWWWNCYTTYGLGYLRTRSLYRRWFAWPGVTTSHLRTRCVRTFTTGEFL